MIVFSSVFHDFSDLPVAIIGGGLSLKGYDFERLKNRCHVIAVNASMFDVSWADCGFTLDLAGYRMWFQKISALTFPVYIAADRGVVLQQRRGVHFLQRQSGAEMARHRGEIFCGGSSGFGALQLAVLAGAKRVFLFGFDYKPVGKVWHHNEQHYTTPMQRDESVWQEWARSFDHVALKMAAKGVSVWNVSPESLIQCFPKIDLEAATQMIRART